MVKVDEMCGFCEEEHEYDLSLGMIQKCKGCGEYIVLCSVCNSDEADCKNCKYAKEAEELRNKERKNERKNIS